MISQTVQRSKPTTGFIAKHLIACLVVLTILATGGSTAWAAKCRYCGSQFGGGRASGLDASYIDGLRRNHERNCSRRRTGSGGGGVVVARMEPHGRRAMAS